jgi:hypothetical protein
VNEPVKHGYVRLWLDVGPEYVDIVQGKYDLAPCECPDCQEKRKK